MKITLDLPVVTECTIGDCAYNVEDMCYAKAITIGDSVNPCCDTMVCGSEHVKSRERVAGVGACKTSNCSFNHDMECSTEVGRPKKPI